MKQTIFKMGLLAVLLTTSLVGCSRSDSGAAAAAEGLQVAVETVPAVPHAKQQTGFVVRVKEQGAAVNKAEVALYLEMREMDHGEHVIRLAEAAPGEYRGAGAFPMAGPWVAHVRVKRAQGTESANVDLVVSE